jgi:hypothetical protein
LQTILADGGGVLVSFSKFLFPLVEHTQDVSPIELEAFHDTSRLIRVVKEDLCPKRDGIYYRVVTLPICNREIVRSHLVHVVYCLQLHVCDLRKSIQIVSLMT